MVTNFLHARVEKSTENGHMETKVVYIDFMQNEEFFLESS